MRWSHVVGIERRGELAAAARGRLRSFPWLPDALVGLGAGAHGEDDGHDGRRKRHGERTDEDDLDHLGTRSTVALAEVATIDPDTGRGVMSATLQASF